MDEAGFDVVIGINHDPTSIETVSSNYRDADFLCCDINVYDMRKLPHTDVLWASVICTEASPAGGHRKLRGQGVLGYEEFGHVPGATYERTRACALDVIRATEIHRYKAVIVENVVEFARDWELYEWWIEGMCTLGYNVQVANLSAAHVYGDGNDPAPQWRDRIFIVFTKKGITLPDLQLRPPSWCEKCEKVVEGEQRFKRPSPRAVGKYGQQYVFVHGFCGAVVEPYVLPAIYAVDLSDTGERIGDRKRPLSTNTMARIEWGLEFLAWPVIAQVAGNTYEREGYHRAWPAFESPLTARQGTGIDAIAGPIIANHGHDGDRVFAADESPLPTRATKISEGVVFPFVDVQRTNNVPRSIDEPLSPVTTGRNHSLVTVPFITMLRNHSTATGIIDPLDTVTTNGRHHYLTSPPGSFYVKNFGGNARPEHLAKSLDSPFGSITTRDHHALVIPYRKGRPARSAMEPLPTIATHAREGLLRPELDIMDCHYRTLKPREHLAAQRFRSDYIVVGNQGEQTMQAGNAVAVNAAHFIGERLLEVLS